MLNTNKNILKTTAILSLILSLSACMGDNGTNNTPSKEQSVVTITDEDNNQKPEPIKPIVPVVNVIPEGSVTITSQNGKDLLVEFGDNAKSSDINFNLDPEQFPKLKGNEEVSFTVVGDIEFVLDASDKRSNLYAVKNVVKTVKCTLDNYSCTVKVKASEGAKAGVATLTAVIDGYEPIKQSITVSEANMQELLDLSEKANFVQSYPVLDQDNQFTVEFKLNDLSEEIRNVKKSNTEEGLAVTFTTNTAGFKVMSDNNKNNQVTVVFNENRKSYFVTVQKIKGKVITRKKSLAKNYVYVNLIASADGYNKIEYSVPVQDNNDNGNNEEDNNDNGNNVIDNRNNEEDNNDNGNNVIDNGDNIEKSLKLRSN